MTCVLSFVLFSYLDVFGRVWTFAGAFCRMRRRHWRLTFFDTLPHTPLAHSLVHSQVVVSPDEPSDAALRRFRREVMTAGLVQEVRRRRYFENSVDMKKRKEKDCRIKTRRDRKFPPRTYAQTRAPEPSPFSELFGTPDDLFADVLSADEGKN